MVLFNAFIYCFSIVYIHSSYLLRMQIYSYFENNNLQPLLLQF